MYQKITKLSKSPRQNNPKSVTDENDKEKHKERYISQEEIQNIIRNQKSIIIVE